LQSMSSSVEELKARCLLIMEADPRELIESSTACCRHCHGEGFGYMWTPAECEKAVATAESAAKPLPDYAGGIGYNSTLDPVPECPECNGRGVEIVRLRDTRDLSAGAAALYKGTKVGKGGQIEVLMHDQGF